jgi:4-deoxy-L-threo-5-hexosulose-uronate ketol-isomerase
MKMELRYAANPRDVKRYDTKRLREEFLIENIFIEDEISLVYSLYDRYIAGGAMPVNREIILESAPELKSGHFLERREMGIINTGGEAEINAGGSVYTLGFKEALYLGKGTRDVSFKSASSSHPAKLYINSTPAHRELKPGKITPAEAERVVLGSALLSNHRTLNKLIVNNIIETCQLQMGMTELKPGSVWNTMPAHTHNRRMEAYFYFEVPDHQAVCHFMGEPGETRHIWIRNEQAVLSPSWSIHSAAGTSAYTFIWGMAGENLDFGDMDVHLPDSLM